MKRAFYLALALGMLALAVTPSHAQEVIRACGPGGPLPAMREAAEVFGQSASVKVEVTAERTESDWSHLEEFALTTAWLEHYGRLPRGVTNALD